jgi:hypothetical protein
MEEVVRRERPQVVICQLVERTLVMNLPKK